MVNGFQVWTLVGALVGVMAVFSAIMIAGFNSLRSELGAKIDGRIDALEARFDGRIDALDGKIDNLARVADVRLSALEHDMHLVKAHLIGQPSA